MWPEIEKGGQGIILPADWGAVGGECGCTKKITMEGRGHGRSIE